MGRLGGGGGGGESTGRLPQQNQRVSEQVPSVEEDAFPLTADEQFIAPSRPTTLQASAFSSSAVGPSHVTFETPPVVDETKLKQDSSCEATPASEPSASRAETSRHGAGPAAPPHAFTKTAPPDTLWSAQLSGR